MLAPEIMDIRQFPTTLAMSEQFECSDILSRHNISCGLGLIVNNEQYFVIADQIFHMSIHLILF